ncbi:DUF5709 domain-containing protein [Streptomyces sp. NPDC090127]|uniref:DUF5709 domain-containing protein n=1 Tax=Streptomyces sp. NPDC090127 TaxID=3365953 RepID=UPI003803038C
MARNEPETQPEGRGDDVYQPTAGEGNDRPVDDLDLENAVDPSLLDAMTEPGYSPPDRPRATSRHGTTQREQREGATLDERLAEEVPDAAPVEEPEAGSPADGDPDRAEQGAGSLRAGRLASVDDDARGRRSPLKATDVGPDDGAATAEEAAMHVRTDEDGDGDGAEAR